MLHPEYGSSDVITYFEHGEGASSEGIAYRTNIISRQIYCSVPDILHTIKEKNI